MVAAAAGALAGDPARTLRTALLAWKTRAPGLGGCVRALAYLLQGLLLARHLVQRGVAHLHNHITGNSAQVAMLASAQSGIPWSTTVHGMELLSSDAGPLGAKLEAAAFTVCISHYTRSQCMLHTAPEHWERMHVVHCGLGPELLEAKACRLPNAMRFVCVGRLSPEKGTPLLLEAAARLVAEGVDLELVLVGDGPQRAALERRSAELGLAGHLRITGWADAETVAQEIRDARALVIPSLSEGLPMVAMEALALGRPVIATRVGGVAELIETGVTGWLVAPGSVEALLAALREAVDADDERLMELAAEGARRVRAHHDAAREARRLANLMGALS